MNPYVPFVKVLLYAPDLPQMTIAVHKNIQPTGWGEKLGMLASQLRECVLDRDNA